MARERAERNGTSSGNGSASPNAGLEVSDLPIGEIRQLIALMDASDLEEIAIEDGDGLKLVLRKPAPSVSIADVRVDLESDDLDGTASEEEAVAHGMPIDAAIEIGAPLVGVYRARAKPDQKPLIRPGDVVREGQIVAAVEALNYVNEIESAAAGRVKEIFVRDGQPVEYGQPLLSIEPS